MGKLPYELVWAVARSNSVLIRKSKWCISSSQKEVGMLFFHEEQDSTQGIVRIKLTN